MASALINKKELLKELKELFRNIEDSTLLALIDEIGDRDKIIDSILKKDGTEFRGPKEKPGHAPHRRRTPKYEDIDEDAIINNHPPPPPPKKKPCFDPALGTSGVGWGQLKVKDGNITPDLPQEEKHPEPEKVEKAEPLVPLAPVPTQPVAQSASGQSSTTAAAKKGKRGKTNAKAPQQLAQPLQPVQQINQAQPTPEPAPEAKKEPKEQIEVKETQETKEIQQTKEPKPTEVPVHEAPAKPKRNGAPLLFLPKDFPEITPNFNVFGTVKGPLPPPPKPVVAPAPVEVNKHEFAVETDKLQTATMEIQATPNPPRENGTQTDSRAPTLSVSASQHTEILQTEAPTQNPQPQVQQDLQTPQPQVQPQMPSQMPQMGQMQPQMGQIQPQMQQQMGQMQPQMSQMSQMPQMQPQMGQMQPQMGQMQPQMGQMQPQMSQMPPQMFQQGMMINPLIQQQISAQIPKGSSGVFPIMMPGSMYPAFWVNVLPDGSMSMMPSMPMSGMAPGFSPGFPPQMAQNFSK